MDLLRERLKARGPACAVLRGGGGGSSETNTTGATTTTTNTDQRMAIQDGVGINGSGNSTSYIVNTNSSDAVVAIANAGANVINNAGGAVVDLFEAAGERNSDAWNATITQGAKLVDRLIDKVGDGFALSEKVVDSFQPAENKNTDAIKWAAIAAGVVGVTALWGKK